MLKLFNQGFRGRDYSELQVKESFDTDYLVFEMKDENGSLGVSVVLTPANVARLIDELQKWSDTSGLAVLDVEGSI